MEKLKSFVKVSWKYIVVALTALVIGSAIGPSQEEIDILNEEKVDLTGQLEASKASVKDLETSNKELSAKNEELSTKVEEAEPYFALSEAERKQREAEVKAKEEAEKARKEAEEKADAEAQAKKEAEEKRLAEEKEKKGYDTGITYDQLARTPDDFIGEKIKFNGKVVQVMEGDGSTQLRIAVNDDYDTIIFAQYESSVVKQRVLEDDNITVMGLSAGLLTYESTMGGNISIPSMLVEKVEQ
ncbi:toxin regulator [Bacillus sp. NTK074B]|uniref:toxin regulator n=1 Tax=Bacillus sp. NTK074B TaxID=2802174 RepID=UPI001A9087C4|nr:toxin regulator [Bacillus sp. NTK074B]